MKKWLDPLKSDQIEPMLVNLIDLEPLKCQLSKGPSVISQDSGVPKERFFPSSICVRQEMKGIFNLFRQQVVSKKPTTMKTGLRTTRGRVFFWGRHVARRRVSCWRRTRKAVLPPVRTGWCSLSLLRRECATSGSVSVRLTAHE
jgi:hypothetical protein